VRGPRQPQRGRWVMLSLPLFSDRGYSQVVQRFCVLRASAFSRIRQHWLGFPNSRGLLLQEALVELLQGSLQRVLVALVQLFLTTCVIDLQAWPALSLPQKPSVHGCWSQHSAGKDILRLLPVQDLGLAGIAEPFHSPSLPGTSSTHP
jgi:hypothetical protein